jgi:CRP-like cAMP-binding protein
MPDLATSDGLLQNELLAVLPKKELARIGPSLEPIALESEQVLWEAGDKRKYIYFPTTAMICLLYETDDGSSAQVGMIGRNGIAGVTTFIGEVEELTRAVVERKGHAFRMKVSEVKVEFSECGDFQELVLCYTQSLINQLSLTAVCNRMHSIEQQLCRWLLINHDALQTKTFNVTHERISNILGVRRESVSLAAGKLQDSDLIRYSRGRIELIDRNGIEMAACQCYGTVKYLHDKMIRAYKSTHGS